MTGDLDERTKLNSYRFVAVNIAQFVVGGFTLPLVAKFAAGHDRQYGWRMTMTLWAGLCFVLFLITIAVNTAAAIFVGRSRSGSSTDI